MKKRVLIFLVSVLALATACIRENFPTPHCVPEGTPVTLTVGFGATAPVEVSVGTKAEATAADESRVHDLYVLIFDNAGNRFYGRFFNYEHRWTDMAPLTSTSGESEGWYVRNKTMAGAKDPVTGQAVNQTVGAVKIATVAKKNCTLVLLANISNTLVTLSGEDPLDALNKVAKLSDLQNLSVRLEQNVVERNDLFLMTGEMKDLDMTLVDGSSPDMRWDKDKDGVPSTDGFGTKYRVTLSPVDAKVKFRIRANSTNISELTSHKWSVSNVPSSCYLLPRSTYAFPTGPSGVSHYYFDTTPLYFDGEETDDAGNKWYTFTFYMMESCLKPSLSGEIPDPELPASYYLREKQNKTASTGNHVKNGDWVYAPANAPYVTFSVSMTLTPDGINDLDDKGPDGSKWTDPDNEKPIGVTGEMTYTVHLGDFSHTTTASGDVTNTPNANDYDTRRGHFYTYDITINNASNLYAEVKYFQSQPPSDSEDQPGQEGSLLLFSGGTVNCDAHYEYREMEFVYSQKLAEDLIADPDYHIYSWFVKTPFNKEGTSPEWDETNHRYVADPTKEDYSWVKFAINKLDDDTDPDNPKIPNTTTYSEKRQAYPGEDTYNPNWYPGMDGAIPKLMDINQLINFLYYQHRARYNDGNASLNPSHIFDKNDVIRLTAFVNEYYYERDPFTGTVNPNLWRQFVNAEPRELYILSDVQSSRDQESHLVNASHSIIQRSIQTIYNVDAPDLSSAWGLEHTDEIRETLTESSSQWNGWEWGVKSNTLVNPYVKSEDNGRINSAALWGLYPAPDKDHDEWSDFLNYDVKNSIPELRDDDTDGSHRYRKMAYSCLTRNRDNNGNGFIDADEVRWYMASINQLKGLWVGNESLSSSARVYQPWLSRNFEGNWRAHILSSTCPDDASKPKVLNAEEGVATFNYTYDANGNPTKPGNWVEGNAQDERLRESVRCVRNVGTYSVGGADLDISDAPYGLIPDNYYTVEETVDPDHASDHNYSTYTLQFKRLDRRSLREYSYGELPFHDEKSSNNRVYLELHIQSRESRKDDPAHQDAAAIYGSEGQRRSAGAKDAGDINEMITNAGYNEFCPAGYRLPNQKELAMMSLVLPNSYWQGGGISRVPSRTYFSRGFYAAPGQQITMEKVKLAWVYSTAKNNILLPDRKDNSCQVSDRVRCVRDNDVTGTVYGNMYLSNNRLMPGESTDLNFNFISSASSFTSGTLYVCYNDTAGNLVETAIPLNRQPEGMQYHTSQVFTAPNPKTLNPSAGDPPTSMRLKLVLKNAKDDTDYVFETPLTIAAVDIHCEFELLPGSEPDSEDNRILCYPIRVQATATNGARIQGLRLLWKKPGDDDWSVLKDHTLDFKSAVGRTEYGTTVYFKPPTVPGATESDPPIVKAATYFFKLEAVSNSTSDNAFIASPKSMQFVVDSDFRPNPKGSTANPLEPSTAFHEWNDEWWQENDHANAKAWQAILQSYLAGTQYGTEKKEQNYIIRYTWKKKLLNLDFAAGDYIEADMDLAWCTYIYTGGNATKDDKYRQIGLDNILSFGRNGIGWDSGSLHVYYPAHVPEHNNSDELRFYSVVSSSGSNYDYATIGRVHEYEGRRPMVLRLDRNGIMYNSMALAWKSGLNQDGSKYPTVVNMLTSSKSLFIGAEEGNHLSRAVYRYVRVIRVNPGNVWGDPNVGFDDPDNGGNL